MTPHVIDCVLFDLDGTLVDTAPEIADAINATLRRLGRGAVPAAQVRDWIGQGTRETLRKALEHAAVPGSDGAALDAAWPGFELDYGETCGTCSALYPGVRPGLERLRAQGRRLALVTNKEGAFAHRVLARHELCAHFDVVVAGDSLPVRKPDPAVVRHVIQTLGVDPRETLLVGDSAADVELARRAGIAVWAVRYGYHRGELTGRLRPDRWVDRIDVVADLPQRIAIA